ncbi:MAG: dienelactone hydrolase family protein [Rhodobacteraceae bacterium]|nr:dienelactone hydrolase family protein [Paracoccaceae bacterium]
MRAIAFLLAVLAAGPAMACGPESDCVVAGERTYRLYLPESDGPMGAILHAHGYRGAAAGSIRNAGLRGVADRLGMAFVALDAGADDWNLAHRPREPGQAEAREYEYVRAVIADLGDRIDLDPDRLIATGFSAGGMMTWTLACGMGDVFAGFVPYAGTFWAPVPETCPAAPAPVIHIHGDEDPTVPLAGRPIGPTWQGDVAVAIEIYGAHGGFGAAQPVPFPHGTGCTVRTGPPGELALCLFQGGHSYDARRVEWAIERILAPS